MDCIYIVLLSKAHYNWCLSIHPFTQQWWLAAMQGTDQLIGSNWGIGVSGALRHTQGGGSNRQPSDRQTTGANAHPVGGVQQCIH